jgi:hypothetical protein
MKVKLPTFIRQQRHNYTRTHGSFDADLLQLEEQAWAVSTPVTPSAESV